MLAAATTMSWTQVHISGLKQNLTLDNDALEATMNDLFGLSFNKDWAGVGTSTFKRTDTNELRGYAFLSFLSQQGAVLTVETINNSTSSNLGKLQAALSQANKHKQKQSSGSKQQSQGGGSASLRLKRRRAPPAPKHPVKSSSGNSKLYRSMKL